MTDLWKGGGGTGTGNSPYHTTEQVSRGVMELVTHRAPPQSVRVGGELCVQLFLHQVDQERGEDEHQEPDVPCGDQLLRNTNDR